MQEIEYWRTRCETAAGEAAAYKKRTKELEQEVKKLLALVLDLQSVLFAAHNFIEQQEVNP